MSEKDPQQEGLPVNPVPVVLTYATPAPSGTGGMTIVGRFGSIEEAEITSSELASLGIPSWVLNKNQFGLGFPYAVLVDVELHVRQEDADRATELLKQAKSDDWEPAESSDIIPAPTDSDGHPIPLAVVATFDSVRQLREAQTLLASSRISAYLPPLVPRGDRPTGSGNRFILRVAEEDFPRAQAVLKTDDAEDSDPDDLHCPRCGAWRVYPVSHFWQGLAAMVGLAPRPLEQVDCLACKYRGPKIEFEPK